MERARFVASLSILGLAVLTGCDGVPQAQNYATVFGRIYDAATSQGLAGVSVAADTVLVALTAPDGTYSISPIPSGQTDVLVTPPEGYAIAVQPVAFSVVNGDRVRLDIALDRI